MATMAESVFPIKFTLSCMADVGVPFEIDMIGFFHNPRSDISNESNSEESKDSGFSTMTIRQRFPSVSLVFNPCFWF